MLSLIIALAKALPEATWHTLRRRKVRVTVDKKTVIVCCKCDARTVAARRLHICPRHGVWLKDAAPPKGWGIRLERQPKGEPIATYYCGPCAEKGA